MLRRTLKVRLYPTAQQKQILRELQIRCAKLWNKANYFIRKGYFKSGIILSYNQVYNFVKNSPEYKALPTDIAQAVLKKLAESWNSFKELKSLERKGKLPKHFKKVSPPKYFKDKGTKQILPMSVTLSSLPEATLWEISTLMWLFQKTLSKSTTLKNA